jgi:type II secretory pathway pseudopilin PulG
MASGRVKRSGGLLTGQGLALAGLITGYISIGLSLLLVPMMLAIAIPNFVKARETAQRNACISNLRQLDGAIEAFALDKKKQSTDPVTFNDLTPYLRGTLVCPAGGTSISDSYRVTDVQSPPTCISPNGGAAHGHVLPR